MTRERIEDMREVVLPFVKKRLLETNYENLGESDAEEFAREFNEILDLAIKALDQEPYTWSLNDAREDFMYDVYNTLDFLPTNEEAYRIIDIFDRVTSSIKQEPILDKVRAEIEQEYTRLSVIRADETLELGECLGVMMSLKIIDKYKAKSEE